MRTALLTIRILSTATWIGGSLYAAMSFTVHARDTTARRALELEESAANKLIGVAVVLLLLSGIGLVLDSSLDGFTTTFVIIGIAAIVVDGALESALIAPRLKKLSESESTLDAALRWMQQRTVVHVIVLAFTVWAMVSRLGA